MNIRRILIDNRVMNNYTLLSNNMALRISGMIDNKGTMNNNKVQNNNNNNEIKKTIFGYTNVCKNSVGGDDEPHYCTF